MAIKQRVHYPNALYHVICRENNKEKIFIEDEDKIEYLNIIKRYESI